MLKYEKYILNLWRIERMKSNTVRIGKRIMAVMLSLMMVAGIFTGMKLDVKALDYTIGNNLVDGQTCRNEAGC